MLREQKIELTFYEVMLAIEIYLKNRNVLNVNENFVIEKLTNFIPCGSEDTICVALKIKYKD